MRWELTTEQRNLQESLGGWLSTYSSPTHVRAWWVGDTEGARAFEQRLRADGWAHVGVPEQLGGSGGGLLEQCLVAEQLGKVTAPSAGWLGEALAAYTVEASGVDVVFDNTGLTVLGVSALVPPGTDWDNSSVRRKILGANGADQIIVPFEERGTVRLRSAPTADLTMFAAPELLDKSRGYAEVELGAAENELGDLPPAAVIELRSRAGVLTAAGALGTMDRLLDVSVKYAGEREQFSAPIGSYQAVQHEAVSILVEVEAARSLVYFAAASIDSDDSESAWHAAAAKAQVTAAGARVAESALTIHGAIGYTWEHDLHFSFKRLKLDQELFGRPSVWNELIADRVLQN